MSCKTFLWQKEIELTARFVDIGSFLLLMGSMRSETPFAKHEADPRLLKPADLLRLLSLPSLEPNAFYFQLRLRQENKSIVYIQQKI